MDTRLKLVLEQQFGKTVLADCYFTAPLKIGMPRMEEKKLKVIFMMASAGILDGDHLDYDITCRQKTNVELAEQSYTKIFDSNGGRASKKMRIRVEKDAVVYYHPCAVIPFQNSCFDSESEIRLDKNAVFAYSEIFAAGRIAMGEQFAFRHFRNKTTVYVDDKPVLMEHNIYEPMNQELKNLYFFDGYTHQGSFFLYSPDKLILDKLYHFEPLEQMEGETDAPSVLDKPEYKIKYGVTHAKEGVLLKILAYCAQDIEMIFREIQRLVCN